MKFKKLFCLALALCLALGALALPASAAGEARSYRTEEPLAAVLKALGLFNGVSDIDLALDRAPDRAQALVMMLRLMGLEPEVRAEMGRHPFEDLDACIWAEPYVGYAYRHGMTKGISDTRFGGTIPADANTYLTFVLRALGYTEGEEGDFLWSDPAPLARELGLLPDWVRLDDFRRADVVTISYAALSATRRDGDATLAEELASRGILSQDALDTYYDPAAAKTGVLAQPYAEKTAEYLRATRVPLGIDISGLPVLNHGSVLQIGDAAYEKYGFYADGPNRCAAQLKAGADAVAGSARVFAIGAPNRLGTVLSEADFARISGSSKSETEAIAYLYEQAGEQVIGVNAIENLRLHNNEYVFFRTDHHWTALGAYYAYEAWAEAAGFEPVPLSSFDVQSREGHLGWFFGLCGGSYLMRQNPDTVTAYIPRSDLTVDFVDSLTSRWTDSRVIYDYNNYGAFLLGDHQLVTITNNDIPDDSACVLVKDSYGNPFAVYLTQHYHTVYVIDYRHYLNVPGYMSFSRFAAEKGVQDFIVLLPMTMQSGNTAGLLSRYCW